MPISVIFLKISKSLNFYFVKYPMVIQCQFEGCGKSFKCNAKLKDHLNSHIGSKPFQCITCFKSFACKRYLDAHIKSHKDVFKCEKCNLTFTRQHNLKRHLKICSLVYKCPNCGKEYKKNGCYLSHINKCKKQENRNNKIKIVRSSNKLAVCEICKAEFNGKRNMIAHIKSVHEKIKYHCNICNKIFSHNCSLRRHMNKTHNEEKNNS